MKNLNNFKTVLKITLFIKKLNLFENLIKALMKNCVGKG